GEPGETVHLALDADADESAGGGVHQGDAVGIGVRGRGFVPDLVEPARPGRGRDDEQLAFGDGGGRLTLVVVFVARHGARVEGADGDGSHTRSPLAGGTTAVSAGRGAVRPRHLGGAAEAVDGAVELLRDGSAARTVGAVAGAGTGFGVRRALTR